MADTSAKNRRYRHAKISEYRLRRVVECFARDMTVKDAAEATKLTRQAIDVIYMRLRERMRDFGLFRMEPNPGEPHPARYVFNRKHQGVPEKYHELYSIELLHRVLCAQNLKGFEELSVANPAHVKKAIRLHKIRQNGMRRYAVIEQQTLKHGEDKPQQIPFDPLDFEETSTLLINEQMIDPQASFFSYLWKLILHHPL